MNQQPTGAVERIARVLAGHRISRNAEGSQASAGDAVDRSWREHTDEAVEILKSLRQAPPSVAAAGDQATWERMIEAALADR